MCVVSGVVAVKAKGDGAAAGDECQTGDGSALMPLPSPCYNGSRGAVSAAMYATRCKDDLCSQIKPAY